jgi:uncharacterized protein (TIGR02145 family)
MGNAKNTTPIVITFANVAVSGVRWANFNSTTPNTGLTTDANNRPVFAADHNFTSFRYFQFNRACAWPGSGAPGTPCGTSWDPTPDNGSNWNETANPVCPTGWRMPTQGELFDLTNNSNPIGGRWVTESTSGFGVPGRFFGPKAGSCSSSNMAGCIFVTAAGHRNYSIGAVLYQGTNDGFWTSTQSDVNNAFFLSFVAASSVNMVYTALKSYGFPIRCVQ